MKRQEQTRTRTALPPSLPPRGLSRPEAAQYVGVSPTKFDEMVKSRTMPPPKRVGARVIWDRIKLDAAFSALPDDGDNEEENPWDSL